jgi:ribosomal protein S12
MEELLMSKPQKELEKEYQSKIDQIMAGPKVKLFIPADRSNPSKHREVIIEGQEFILAVGKQLEVPQVVAEVWQDSYSRTIEAEQRMEKFDEL